MGPRKSGVVGQKQPGREDPLGMVSKNEHNKSILQLPSSCKITDQTDKMLKNESKNKIIIK